MGNVSDLAEVSAGFGPRGLSQLILGVCGLAVGIFVGCLVMSLAETLKALPAISRRLKLAVGLPYVILAIALGKTAGALVYFVKRFGSG